MSTSEAWLPPDDPDPGEILDSVLKDKRESKYEQALAKLLWFHKHALGYDRHYSSVRVSFALGYWFDLAQQYPPAMDAFYAARDQAEQACDDTGYSFEHFQELASFNRVLREGSRTAELFKRIAHSDVKAAHMLYDLAEPFLIENGDYAVCDPFLDPHEQMNRFADFYRMQSEFEDSMEDDPNSPPKLAREIYVSESGTLVALLARNNRLADAQEAYDCALETIDDAEFRQILDAAMKGNFPASWSGFRR